MTTQDIKTFEFFSLFNGPQDKVFKSFNSPHKIHYDMLKDWESKQTKKHLNDMVVKAESLFENKNQKTPIWPSAIIWYLEKKKQGLGNNLPLSKLNATRFAKTCLDVDSEMQKISIPLLLDAISSLKIESSIFYNNFLLNFHQKTYLNKTKKQQKEIVNDLSLFYFKLNKDIKKSFEGSLFQALYQESIKNELNDLKEFAYQLSLSVKPEDKSLLSIASCYYFIETNLQSKNFSKVEKKLKEMDKIDFDFKTFNRLSPFVSFIVECDVGDVRNIINIEKSLSSKELKKNILPTKITLEALFYNIFGQSNRGVDHWVEKIILLTNNHPQKNKLIKKSCENIFNWLISSFSFSGSNMAKIINSHPFLKSNLKNPSLFSDSEFDVFEMLVNYVNEGLSFDEIDELNKLQKEDISPYLKNTIKVLLSLDNDFLKYISGSKDLPHPLPKIKNSKQLKDFLNEKNKDETYKDFEVFIKKWDSSLIKSQLKEEIHKKSLISATSKPRKI